MESDPAGQSAQQTVIKAPGGKFPFSAVLFVISLVILAVSSVFVFFPAQVVKFLPFTSYYIKTVSIPLDITSPDIYRASFVYAFRTRVEGVEQKNGQSVLKTDLKGIKDLPQFIIDQNTKIAFVQNNNDVEVFNGDTTKLKKGELVYVYITYSILEKKWSTTRVAVVMPEPIQMNSFKRSNASGSGKLNK